jgi:hypothetical protein
MYQRLLLIAAAAGLVACQSAYYEAAEQLGYHKREILVDRVEDARDAQTEAEEQFQSAQEQLMALIEYDGGKLQDAYEDLADEYEDSVAAAQDVSDRIDAIEDVAEALFEEWEEEITQYQNARFKADSQRKLRQTQSRYKELVKALRASEKRMEPILSAMNDNVLYLKHNLNAQAVAALKVEFDRIDKDIEALIAEMRRAIETSNQFIDSLQQQ